MPRKATNQQSNQYTNNVSDGSNEISYDIITAQGWNVMEHNCSVAKPNKSGQGKTASLTYNKRKFYLKTPKMFCPFGVSKPKPKPGEQEKENDPWSVQLSFGDDGECQVFQRKSCEFDEFMIDEGTKVDNCVNWLGGSKTKPFSREVVDSKYSKMVKYSKDKNTGEQSTQYPPFIRAVLPTSYKSPYEFTCEIYDKNNELLSVSPNATHSNGVTKVIPFGCYCSALLSGSIWCNTTGFGVTWRVAQLKVFPPRGTIPKGKCLVDDPVSEEEEEEDEEEEKSEDEEKNADEEIIEEDESHEVVNPSGDTESPSSVVESKPKKVLTKVK